MLRQYTRSWRGRRSSPALRVWRFVALVFIACLPTLWPGRTIAVDWSPLALLTALTVLAEAGAVDTSGRGKTSVAVVPVLAAAFLYGSMGILATVLALTVTVGIIGRSPLQRILFNFGALILSAQGARAIFATFVGGPFGQLSLARMLIPAAFAGLVYYVINHLLLSIVRAVAEQRSPFQIWRTEYRWLWPYYPVLGVLALTVAVAYRTFGIAGLIGLLAPVAMMQLVVTQYLAHTAGYIAELQRLNVERAETYEATLDALTRALDLRDTVTKAHSQRVRHFTDLIALQLGVSEAVRADLRRGALLHDIGKIGVPDAILRKPGPLTDEEWVVMREHPEIGYTMIAHIAFLAPAATIVLHHHESFDGSGYPEGLSGAAIPLGARIFAVADAFDAMTSDRPYKRAIAPRAALKELWRHAGRQFDPQVVEAFAAVVPID